MSSPVIRVVDVTKSFSLNKQKSLKERVVNLGRKVPVYIVYFTTFMRDGQLNFGNDLYDRDGALVKAVFEALTPSEQVNAESAELRDLADGGIL